MVVRVAMSIFMAMIVTPTTAAAITMMVMARLRMVVTSLLRHAGGRLVLRKTCRRRRA